jgi:hydrogenase nickel incorporation protein HypA/HybF
MHELSLMTALVDQVRELSMREKFTQVLSLRLAVGEQSGASPEALEFCFPEATQGTILEGARLELESVPLSLRCDHCQAEFRPDAEAAWRCSSCASGEVRVCGGKELRLVHLEVPDQEVANVS